VRSFTTIPHAKLLQLLKQRVTDGRLLRLLQQSRKVGGAYQGQVAPTVVGVPQGSPRSPLSRNISLPLWDQVGHQRGYPETLGATLHRYADEAILVCRHRASRALQAFAAIATRMALTLTRDTTRSTQLPEGGDFLGVPCVKRRRPTRGKMASELFPRQAAQRRGRRRSKACTKRRAPLAPQDFVLQVHQVVRGWGNDDRHTTAPPALRAWPRFLHVRWRRSLPCRRQGRGVGWQHYPNRALYARGLIYIGRGVLRYARAPGHARACRLSARRMRENGTYGGMGRGWGPDDAGAREALRGGNPQPQIGVV
jgi:hypothetical protein